MSKGLVVGCSIGNCVHVAGAAHFLSLAEEEGYRTLYLGPAVSADTVLACVRREKPVMVAVGYRLTPASGAGIIRELIEKSQGIGHKPLWIFGGTRPVAELVREFNFFDVIFDGTDDLDDSIALLRTGIVPRRDNVDDWPDTLAGRIARKAPYPLLRHHFGLPSYEDTLRGVGEIADSRALDVISLGIDQNTQQYYFNPQARERALEGAGGVPVHTDGEFAALYLASRRGNFPLMRCYSGTSDVLRFAELLRGTIHNAWCAVPLCWYNELDGRGERRLEVSIREAQELIRYHGRRNIPVEVNEPHHWGLRDAHDVISVAMAYISAYNAKKYGAREYVAQYMFNIPNGVSFSMDLAKVLAQLELAESLGSPDFRVYRQVRAGLPFLSADQSVAKGQLAASAMLSMNIAPHIIHVVGYSEAERAASPEVVVESCRIVRGVVRSVLDGAADMAGDPRVTARKNELLGEARYLLEFIVSRYSAVSEDPLADAGALSDCIKRGIIDAPHILKRGEFKGNLRTRLYGGSCLAYDPGSGRFLNERERLASLTEGSGNE